MTRWISLRHVLAAAVIVAFGALLSILAYVKLGVFNVAASHPHSMFVEWVTHETMINSVRMRASPRPLPRDIDVEEAKRGFCVYDAHCVECHGAPAVARAQWTNGLNPAPPYLLDAPRDWKPQELEWIVRNGIKMTGMPAWRESMSGPEIRDVVLFLEAMPRMQPQLYREWRRAQVCGKRNSFNTNGI